MSEEVEDSSGSGEVYGCPPSPPLGPPPEAIANGSILVHAIEVAFYTNSQVLIYVAIGAYCVHTMCARSFANEPKPPFSLGIDDVAAPELDMRDELRH